MDLAESGLDLPAKPGWPYILPSFLSSTCALPGKQIFFLEKLCSPETKCKFFFLDAAQPQGVKPQRIVH